MKRVFDLLNEKDRSIWSSTPDTTVYEAIRLMADKEIGSLLVMEGEALVGILSERDYARKVILKGKSSRETMVSEIMSCPVVCIPPESTVQRAMSLMTDHHVRHLPVTVKERVVGVISIGDVVKGIIDDKQSEIEELTNYITQDPNI